MCGGRVVLQKTARSLFFFSLSPSDSDAYLTNLYNKDNQTHLSTMDLLVLATMKNAANCDNVIWIAEFDESSTFWTHIAPEGPSPFGMLGWGSLFYHNTLHCKRLRGGPWTFGVYSSIVSRCKLCYGWPTGNKTDLGVEEVGFTSRFKSKPFGWTSVCQLVV